MCYHNSSISSICTFSKVCFRRQTSTFQLSKPFNLFAVECTSKQILHVLANHVDLPADSCDSINSIFLFTEHYYYYVLHFRAELIMAT